MKKLIVLMAVIVAAFMVIGLAYAGEEEDPNHDVQQTTGTVFETPYAPLTSWLNSNVSSTSDIYIPTRRAPRGIGADIVLLETQSPLLENITAEGRYDFNNDELSVYGVARINAFKAISGLFR